MGFELAVPNARRLGQLRGRAAGLLALKLAKDEPADELRELIRDLGKVNRDDVLPIDHEAEEHAREEHGGEAVWTDADGMEGLEAGVDSLAGKQETKSKSMREEALLAGLEQRLQQIAG